MVINLLFLILLLFIINTSPEATPSLLTESPVSAWIFGIILYATLLSLIFIQNRFIPLKYKKIKQATLSNIWILLFFLFYHFVLCSHRLYSTSSATLLALPSLILYLYALYFHHKTAAPLSDHRAALAVRFLVPFTLPFLIFSLIVDLSLLLPNATPSDGEISLLSTTIVGFFLLLGGMLLFLPPLVQMIWGCKKIEDQELLHRLENFCRRAKFKHGGIKNWPVLNSSYTAAIIGILPRYRYILFTEALLRTLPEEEIEAILAHEMGHSYRKHLLIYPFIMMGMVLVTALLTLLFQNGINDLLALKLQIDPESHFWRSITPLSTFLPHALILILYVRIIFGFFSRQFERQADLYPIEVGASPTALIGALNHVAILNGIPPSQPNWHHYSIEERIHFIAKAIETPSSIQSHHRKTYLSLALYSFLFITGALFLISPLFPESPVLSHGSQAIENFSTSFSSSLTKSSREKRARQLIDLHSLEGNRETIEKAIAKSYTFYAAIEIPGIVEYYASQILLQSDQLDASAKLMIAAWRALTFDEGEESVYKEFKEQTDQIIEKIEGKQEYSEQLQLLIEEKEKGSREIK